MGSKKEEQESILGNKEESEFKDLLFDASDRAPDEPKESSLANNEMPDKPISIAQSDSVKQSYSAELSADQLNVWWQKEETQKILEEIQQLLAWMERQNITIRKIHSSEEGQTTKEDIRIEGIHGVRDKKKKRKASKKRSIAIAMITAAGKKVSGQNKPDGYARGRGIDPSTLLSKNWLGKNKEKTIDTSTIPGVSIKILPRDSASENLQNNKDKMLKIAVNSSELRGNKQIIGEVKNHMTHESKPRAHQPHIALQQLSTTHKATLSPEKAAKTPANIVPLTPIIANQKPLDINKSVAPTSRETTVIANSPTSRPAHHATQSFNSIMVINIALTSTAILATIQTSLAVSSSRFTRMAEEVSPSTAINCEKALTPHKGTSGANHGFSA